MFAFPAPAAEIEELVFETAEAVPGFGRVVFVTVLARHAGREREARESHVFLPAENRHLHEIVFAPIAREDAGDALADAVSATHGLFAKLAQGRLGEERRSGLAYATRRLAEHPFHEFRLRGWFAGALWEIQDWTGSGALREALGRVTGYRADADEAELLRRVFAAA